MYVSFCGNQAYPIHPFNFYFIQTKSKKGKKYNKEERRKSLRCSPFAILIPTHKSKSHNLFFIGHFFVKFYFDICFLFLFHVYISFVIVCCFCCCCCVLMQSILKWGKSKRKFISCQMKVKTNVYVNFFFFSLSSVNWKGDLNQFVIKCSVYSILEFFFQCLST